MIFKCKMCGGTIEFEQGATVGVCDYCGTKQTLPRLDGEKKANLYDRADHFRRNNDYDKAAGIYEQILNEDTEDAEAYWSLVLCRYGIEYVEDPASHRRVPTVNRAQFTSVLADEDYKSALQYADGYQRSLYEEEAKAIDEIQRGILDISQKEEPFDVFICYKETDANGRRTQDSVLATDLYHQLTGEGFKVFFSRITLEDKLGTAYEPYIFAALNSSKVMVALGTKPEYFNAVWVKNEWSRYLALIKNGAKKMLIPAYRDMDPYDLPEEFSHLQAQDMSKLGFMQDLIRGIKKILGADAQPAVKETVVVRETASAVPGNESALLKRGFMALEDGEWEKADGFFEEVLNQDAENAQAYLGKLLAELKVRKKDDLKDLEKPFDDSKNYQKAVRFGDTDLPQCVQGINERNEQARLEGIYQNAVCAMSSAHSENAFLSASDIFRSISGYRDADVLSKQCLKSADTARKDTMYASAIGTMKLNYASKGAYETALSTFQKIPGWKDADAQVENCRRKIKELEEKEETDHIKAEKAAKKKNKFIVIIWLILCVCILFWILLTMIILPNSKYNAAVKLMNDGKYDEAISAFEALNGYKDSNNQLENCYIGKYGEEKWNIIKNIKVGDTYTFGAYEQDNNTSNGKEAIEWTVLDKNGMSLLLISKQALDCQQYNTSNTDITWENCSLRKWMNSTFLNNAFSAEEQAQIESTPVSADKNPNYSTNPGNATTDKVFLLSITEAEKYFSSDSARQCSATAYAKAQGTYTNTSNGNCWWWLRSPGDGRSGAASVYDVGSVYFAGYTVNRDIGAVRPALWINLE